MIEQESSLYTLGIDIIESEIIPLLSPNDIKSLKLTSKPLYNLIETSGFIWQELYKKTFGTKPTSYSLSKWPDIYKLRSKGKLYTWGTLSGGRLGLSVKDLTQDQLSRQRFNVGVCQPVEVPGVDLILADVSAGGFSFQILTDKGEIYSTSSYHAGHGSVGPGPGDHDVDYNELQQLAREQESQQRQHGLTNIPLNTPLQRNAFLERLQRQDGVALPVDNNNGIIRIPRVIDSFPYRIPTQPETNPSNSKISNRYILTEQAMGDPNLKFVSVSSGRAHFIALDQSGNIWSWDGGPKGVKIRFKNGDRDLVRDEGHSVLRCVAGWNLSVAYLYNYGLVYWRSRSALKNAGDFEADAKFSKIIGTGDVNGDDRIVDFMAGEDFIIYVNAKGELFKNDIIGEPSYLLVEFQKYLKLNGESLSSKFTRLSGSFKNFAVFSNEDIVLIGSKDSNEPIVIEELQHKQCVSVSVGDYHYLALLRDGTLLSWGLESNSCGCLGLGKFDQIQEQANVENGSIRVRKPRKVQVDGKVVAIAAAGWQSSAIISN